MILVTGAAGHLGGSIIKHLLSKIPADQIVTLVRDESKAAKLKNAVIATRPGDYHNAASLSAAFVNVDKAVLISSNDFNDCLTQHKNVIAAAKAAGVGHKLAVGHRLSAIGKP